jgi:epoxide hydrolase-like predicted phosphatase
MIKFIYFDVGGVLMKDFSGNNNWVKMKKAMGVRQADYKELDALYDKYEREELNLTRKVDSLISIFESKFNMKFPPNFSMFDFFIEHFEQNPNIWPIVRKVKRKYKVGLLTNMYIGMLDAIKKREILPDINWDVVLDSSKVQTQKPEKSIYALAQQKSGVEHQEILFIDNTRRNLLPAKNLGWRTFYYDSTDHRKSCEELRKYLDNLMK